VVAIIVIIAGIAIVLVKGKKSVKKSKSETGEEIALVINNVCSDPKIELLSFIYSVYDTLS
jgi:hypothetical protein